MNNCCDKCKDDMEPFRNYFTVKDKTYCIYCLKEECLLSLEKDKEIERLKEKCNTQSMILRQLIPEKYDTYFITGEQGDKDQTGMPEKLLVVPTYGCDFWYVYKRMEISNDT